MSQRQIAKVFLSSKMDSHGMQYHSYRQALTNWIESEYPFLQIDAFEDGAYPGDNRTWETNAIRDADLFIALIVEDSDEVKHEIRQAMNFKNPVFLFFFPDKTRAAETWTEFAISKRVKSKEASSWKELIESIRDSIDRWIIELFKEKKGKHHYELPQPMEEI
jgi:hypothetical protein